MTNNNINDYVKACLFPFEYRVTKETLLEDERFVMNNFDGELLIALKD